MLNLITVKLWDRPRASNRPMPKEFAIDSPQQLSLVQPLVRTSVTLEFLNALDDGVCTTCAPGDQEKSIKGKRLP